jgi:hypothetical protein
MLAAPFPNTTLSVAKEHFSVRSWLHYGRHRARAVHPQIKFIVFFNMHKIKE